MPNRKALKPSIIKHGSPLYLSDTLENQNKEWRQPINSFRHNYAETGFIGFEKVSKTYLSGNVTVNAIKDVSFEINRGELVIMLGSSGAGKSTVLNILGGMDYATSGRVIVNRKIISGYTIQELAEYRRNEIGFVFQFYNLMQNLTAKENIELATGICKTSFDAVQMLQDVGLGDRINNFPSQLSGGEQQRISIARALAKNPLILLCDEPTGALDYENGKQILSLLQQRCHRQGITTIIITHNNSIAPMGDKVINFKSGQVVDIKSNLRPTPVEYLEW